MCGLVSRDLRRGFIIINVLFVAFGVWCWPLAAPQPVGRCARAGLGVGGDRSRQRYRASAVVAVAGSVSARRGDRTAAVGAGAVAGLSAWLASHGRTALGFRVVVRRTDDAYENHDRSPSSSVHCSASRRSPRRARTPSWSTARSSRSTASSPSGRRSRSATGRSWRPAARPRCRSWRGPSTRVIDLQGRTVIPGLIDSHLHAIRAALSFSTEVNWIGAPSLTDALGRIRDAARTMRPGAWLIVAGGWNVQQFKENRRPTQAELVAAAPNNPVYVQLGYGWSMLTPLAMKALSISSEADLPSGGRFEKDASGKLTGAVTGGQGAIIALFDKLPRPGFDDQVEGTTQILPRAQSPRGDRCRRSGRQQPHAGRLSGALQGLAGRPDDGPRRLQSVRADAGRGVRGAEELDRAPADRFRRPDAALQRPRRTHHRRDEQQRSADGVGQGSATTRSSNGRRSAACRSPCTGGGTARSISC